MNFKFILLLIFVTTLLSSCYEGNTIEPYGLDTDSVRIGTQTWMLKNLGVIQYRNGDIIPEVKDAEAWASLTTGAWCYYSNDSKNGKTYGKLYNWYAVNDPRGLAPEGWHIASEAEWALLSTYLGGDAVSGAKLKESGTTHWMSPNEGATNLSGFTALPGGNRSADGGFYWIRSHGCWWTSTEYFDEIAYYRDLKFSTEGIDICSDSKACGFSVRCVKFESYNIYKKTCNILIRWRNMS